MSEGDRTEREPYLFSFSLRIIDTLVLAKIFSSIDPFNRIQENQILSFHRRNIAKGKKREGEGGGGSLLETTLDKSFGQNWEVRSLLTLVTSENTMLDDYKGRSLR